MNTTMNTRIATWLAGVICGSALACGASATAGDGLCVDTPVAIPDNTPGGVAVPIGVMLDSDQRVETVEVLIELSHPWIGDLVIELETPDGRVVTLLDRAGLPNAGFPGPFGCGGRDIDATFSDAGSIDAEDVCSFSAQPVLTGSVRPSETLTGFAGAPAAGTWVLRVADRSAFDVGTLERVCLSLTTSAACEADLTGDGLLDFFDVSVFLDAFANEDPVADLDGNGAFDFFDVQAYLGLFAAGCS